MQQHTQRIVQSDLIDAILEYYLTCFARLFLRTAWQYLASWNLVSITLTILDFCITLSASSVAWILFYKEHSTVLYSRVNISLRISEDLKDAQSAALHQGVEVVF